jgi:putative serine protease PepD
MTMTFEPFTPAGTPDQGEYDGRRRAESRPAADPWAEAPRTEQWTEPQSGQWAEPHTQQWAEPRADQWTESRAEQWTEPRAPQQWEEPREFREEPRAARAQQWPDLVQAQPVPTQPAPAEHWTGDRRWDTGSAGEQPRRAPELDEPAPVVRDRAGGGRVKPLVLGVVVVLLLVAGWQAYRIEGMNKHNAALATVLTTEKDRTDRLEKELAGVFDPEAVSSGVLPSVFRVRAGDFTGTAFSVGRKAAGGQSNLLTNYHVVAGVWTAGGRKVTLERGATRINATIVKVSKGKDLALLRAEQEIAGLATASAQVKPGQQVVVVGAPLGLDDTVTTGVISAWRPDDADGPTIQFDAPINPGNSGGPVVNAGEQVVGLATAKAKDAEGIGLAIPIRTACETFAGIC